MGFGSGQRLWATSGQAVMVSGQNTKRWQQIYPAIEPTGAVTEVSAKAAYAAGDASDPTAVLQSTNDGRTWKVVASLATRQAVAFAFLGDKDGWMAAIPMTMDLHTTSVLMHTIDGGRPGSVVYQPAQADSIYPALKFSSPKHGLFVNLLGQCHGICPIFGSSTSSGGRHWHVLQGKHVPANINWVAIVSPQTFVAATLGGPNPSDAIYQSSNGGKSWQKLLQIPTDIGRPLTLTFRTASVGYLVLTHLSAAVS